MERNERGISCVNHHVLVCLLSLVSSMSLPLLDYWILLGGPAAFWMKQRTPSSCLSFSFYHHLRLSVSVTCKTVIPALRWYWWENHKFKINAGYRESPSSKKITRHALEDHTSTIIFGIPGLNEPSDGGHFFSDTPLWFMSSEFHLLFCLVTASLLLLTFQRKITCGLIILLQPVSAGETVYPIVTY